MFQAVCSPYRTVITVNGSEAAKFLQGLITNDINLLENQPCIYACFLTAQGKFLHDFHIFKQDNTYYLTPEKDRATDLLKRLKMYKLRADVEITIVDYLNVFHFWPALPEGFFPADSLLAADPRHKDLGQIGIFSDTNTQELLNRVDGMGAGQTEHLKESSISSADYNAYDAHRITLKIPDGSRDMPPEKAILLEYGLDNLNAISYEKGCYLGQELTARTHYRGLVRKELQLVTGDALPESGTPLYGAGSEKSTATMCSSNGHIGLALVRVGTEFPLSSEDNKYIANHSNCT